jgi:alkanesulfonate monooxygenase SsuD/methylene tetrahydromethanopterin reductase-like flavin-dependent oxidoreductase (luciferase family)
MRYGFYLPTRGPTATRDGVLALAREDERLGFHSAMIADHIVSPVECKSTYPYTLDGKHPSVGDALEGLCHGNSIKHAWRAEARDASCHSNDILPLCSGFGSEDPKGGSRDEVALKVEGVVDRTMHVEEALGGSS